MLERSSAKDQGGPLCFHPTLSPALATKSFSLVQNAFLQADDLPFADVLTEEEIARDVRRGERLLRRRRRRHLHARGDPVGMVVAGDARGRARSCVAAVARVTRAVRDLGPRAAVAGHGDLLPRAGETARARARSGWCTRWAMSLESRVPADWLWLGRHVKMADGTTLLTPDTDANQDDWPQARTQKPGVGFPILRMVVLLSLATAALCGLAIGPYKGKETGEPALLRELLDRFQPGDVFLGDCCFCFVLPAGVVAGPRRGRGDASAPASADRLPLRPAAGREGPRGGLAAARTTRVDGRGNLRHDSRDAHACGNCKCVWRSAAFACRNLSSSPR